MNWYREESKKWSQVARNFKEAYAELETEWPTSTTVTTKFCPDCEEYVEAEWRWGEHGEKLICLQCGNNINF